jgi:Putative Ig domain
VKSTFDPIAGFYSGAARVYTTFTEIAYPLRVTTVDLPLAKVGVPYSVQLEATGGWTPYRWASKPPFPLPHWLELTEGGLLHGTPPSAGTSHLTISVLDNYQPPAEASSGVLLLKVVGAAPQPSTSE